jgi:hypothetical protein
MSGARISQVAIFTFLSVGLYNSMFSIVKYFLMTSVPEYFLHGNAHLIPGVRILFGTLSYFISPVGLI